MRTDSGQAADQKAVENHYEVLPGTDRKKNKLKVRCKYCSSEFTSPAGRLIHHFARPKEGAFNIAKCSAAPEDVVTDMVAILSRKRKIDVISIPDADEVVGTVRDMSSSPPAYRSC